mmetsp:Transcript_32397/g.109169  ORF Transcript_32397/g.109169 Transcript_32397/m.109169 type:complete len:202 (+) Transcript_32397:3788-4393(+)
MSEPAACPCARRGTPSSPFLRILGLARLCAPLPSERAETRAQPPSFRGQRRRRCAPRRRAASRRCAPKRRAWPLRPPSPWRAGGTLRRDSPLAAPKIASPSGTTLPSPPCASKPARSSPLKQRKRLPCRLLTAKRLQNAPLVRLRPASRTPSEEQQSPLPTRPGATRPCAARRRPLPTPFRVGQNRRCGWLLKPKGGLCGP